MIYSTGQDKDSLFVKDFLSQYMSIGFSNLPKRKIDILVFHLISKYGYLENTEQYRIARELNIDENKLRRFMLDAALRYGSNDTVTVSMAKLKELIFSEEPAIQLEIKDETVSLLIEDPVIKRDFVYAVRQTGYAYDKNLNPERVTLTKAAFVAAFSKYNNSIETAIKNTVREQTKSDTEYKRLFSEQKPLVSIMHDVLVLLEGINTLVQLKALFGL